MEFPYKYHILNEMIPFTIFKQDENLPITIDPFDWKIDQLNGHNMITNIAILRTKEEEMILLMEKKCQQTEMATIHTLNVSTQYYAQSCDAMITSGLLEELVVSETVDGFISLFYLPTYDFGHVIHPKIGRPIKTYFNHNYM